MICHSIVACPPRPVPEKGVVLRSHLFLRPDERPRRLLADAPPLQAACERCFGSTILVGCCIQNVGAAATTGTLEWTYPNYTWIRLGHLSPSIDSWPTWSKSQNSLDARTANSHTCTKCILILENNTIANARHIQQMGHQKGTLQHPTSRWYPSTCSWARPSGEF